MHRARLDATMRKVEPGLSWPQGDVLTTGRFGVLSVGHLGDVALAWIAHSVSEELARIWSVLPSGFAAVCGCWGHVFCLSDRGFQDALPPGGHVSPLQRRFCGDGLSAGLVV